MTTKKPKLIRLPDSVAVAAAAYFLHRHQTFEIQTVTHRGEDGKSQITYLAHLKRERWDKEGDMQKVFTAIDKAGYVATGAVAGTFWFANKSYTRSYEVNETTWPFAQSSPVKKD